MQTNDFTNLIAFIASFKQELQQEIVAGVTTSLRKTIGELLAEQQGHSATLLKETDVVKMYKVSRSFLRKLRNEEGLPYLKIGDAVRYEKVKLDAFFEMFNS